MKVRHCHSAEEGYGVAVGKGLYVVVCRLHVHGRLCGTSLGLVGMAQRGGSVTSHVRIGEAYAPLIPQGAADMILAFEPAEAVRNLGYLKKDGIVIVNRVPVKPVTESLQDTGYDGTEMIAYLQKKCSCIVIDAEKICAPFGSSRYFNIAILGVAVGSGRLGISKETVLAELERRVPSKYVETNKAAFYAGVEVGSGKTL